MSDEDSVPTVSQIRDAPVASPEARPRYKSWRKKYRKMKSRFDGVMKQNSTMFRDEQKLEALAKRLLQQNDQILDLLLDLNSSLVIPPEQRYKVKYRQDWADRQDLDLSGANDLLANALEMDQQGRLSQSHYWQMKTSMEDHVAASEAEDLGALEERVPQPRYVGEDGMDLDPTSLLLTAHEEEYLHKVDSKLGDHLSSAAGGTGPVSWSTLSARDMEREVELRNPLSVHNWLKKHIPGFGDEDKSDVDGSSGKKSLARSTAKRVHERAAARDREDDSPSGAVGGRHENDHMDDELGMDEAPVRGRKSRGADDAYRPRGGSGGTRAGRMKRKREDGDSRLSGKKHKTSMGDIGDI